MLPVDAVIIKDKRSWAELQFFEERAFLSRPC